MVFRCLPYQWCFYCDKWRGQTDNSCVTSPRFLNASVILVEMDQDLVLMKKKCCYLTLLGWDPMINDMCYSHFLLSYVITFFTPEEGNTREQKRKACFRHSLP